MELLILILLLLSFCIHSFSRPIEPTSKITVQGAVFCDICNNFDTQQSYGLAGVDVQVECKFKTNSQIFLANTTTNEHGGYKVELPLFEGVGCDEGQFLCQATSIRSSLSTCNITGLNINPKGITLKFKQYGLCIHAMDVLTFTPIKRNITLCGNQDDKALPTSLNSSNTFLPKQLDANFASRPVGSAGGGGLCFPLSRLLGLCGGGGSHVPCFPLSRLLGLCGGGKEIGSGLPCLPFLPLPGCIGGSGGSGGGSGFPCIPFLITTGCNWGGHHHGRPPPPAEASNPPLPALFM